MKIQKMIKFIIPVMLLVLMSCDKEPLTDVKCYDCLIKQHNGTEYPAVFCVTASQYQDIINNENYTTTCTERKQ